MIVLSRRNGESIVVGGFPGYDRLLKVTVLEIGDGKVRLGFDVAADVPVQRLEAWERIHRGGFLDPMREDRAPPQPSVA